MPLFPSCARILAFCVGVSGVTAVGAQSPNPPPSLDSSSHSYSPRLHPELHVSLAPGPIKIDGDLSDSGWVGAQAATDFSEHSPGEEVEPPVKTKAFVTFDKDHLYLAAICYAPRGSVRASVCEREQIFDDDNIGFFFDTYGDANLATIPGTSAFLVGLP